MKRPPWSKDELEAMRLCYIVQGLSAEESGRRIGRSEQAVRGLACRLGWKRDPAFRVVNASAASLAAVSLGRAPAEKPAPAAPTPHPADADLIAAFLARKAVTVLAPGTAAGLSYYEREIHAAPPPHCNWRDRQARGLKAMRERQGRAA